MIEIIVALVGSIAAGIWDLYTTEVPDEIPALMISIGVFYWFINAVSIDFYPLFISLLVGTILLIFGFAMYRTKQWGGADALMLASIGYLIPIYAGSIFIIDYVINFFIVGAIYTIIYAIILGFIHRKVFGFFVADLKKNIRLVLGIPGIFAIFVIFMFIIGVNIIPLLYVLLLIILITIFWRYGTIIENRLFKKRVLTENLKPGDVVDNMRWVGLTEEQIKRIRRKKKYATVKEGIRFIPVFPIALIVTLLFGNVVLLFI